ncbi:MAG TPA: T9SS type A sorting domain-containing protein, partial [Bacteroidia bacterium]|nr:T9SS type A sorting domain-containing protein [Bacteroidia bacterium]
YTSVDSAVVWFPSGTTTVLTNLASNQFVTVVEGGCSISGNTLTGPFILCTGQTLNLNAASGFATYDWSTGATTQSIVVSTAGAYNVQVTDGNGCSNISPSATILVNPDETPSVTATGELEFCEGGAVMLTSSPANSYSWSDGSTTQSISATVSGSYVVTIQGTCGLFSSTAIQVDVLNAPEPVGTGATGPSGSQLLLTATGDSLTWYDQQTGGSVVGNGNNFTTPPLTTTTTYWVESVTDYPGAIAYTGMTYHQGTLYSGGVNTNSNIIFDVLAPSILVSVKVYTDTPGNREVQLLDNTGAVLNSQLVNIPLDTSRVTLNFPLAPGTGYQLTTNAAVNVTSLGTVTPRLQRSSQGVLYPYTLSNLVSLTGSNQGAGFYYYFYDWEVQEPSYYCVSDRVPVVADITTGIAVNQTDGVSAYPNPAHETLFIHTGDLSGKMNISLTDVSGRVVRNLTIECTPGVNEELSLKGLASGIYNLKLESSQHSSVRQVMIR